MALWRGRGGVQLLHLPICSCNAYRVLPDLSRHGTNADTAAILFGNRKANRWLCDRYGGVSVFEFLLQNRGDKASGRVANLPTQPRRFADSLDADVPFSIP